MARLFQYVEGDKIGDYKIEDNYIKIQDVDLPAFDDDGLVFGAIKNNYIDISHLPESAFQLKMLGKCRVIGPFHSIKTAESIINKINGYCSRLKAKGEN